MIISMNEATYEVEYVPRRSGEMVAPPWPVCGRSQTVVRTLDGAHWFRKEVGCYTPQPWTRIATPARQPALRQGEPHEREVSNNPAPV